MKAYSLKCEFAYVKFDKVFDNSLYVCERDNLICPFIIKNIPSYIENWENIFSPFLYILYSSKGRISLIQKSSEISLNIKNLGFNLIKIFLIFYCI